jgi:hypothetical protein
MTENIIEAKNELFESLRGYHEVVGASVKRAEGKKYIVILLTRFNSNIKKKIPDTFKGNDVRHELIGHVTAI